jgi:hypothetical protein
MDTPTAVILVLLVALLGLWGLTEGGSGSPEGAAAPVRTAPVSVIARRVEALRDLRFERVPEPVAVTPEQARREGLRDLDRTYPEARRRADERMLKLLGVIEPDADFRELTEQLFGEGVAGYYDPRTKRLRTVKGADSGSRVLAEIVLAHELTHALEDQRYRLEELGGGDDHGLAYLALVEGTATVMMYRYADRHFTAEEAIGGLAASAFQDPGSLPPFVTAQLVFPYVGGQAFVDDLLRRAGGRWDLVDTAYRLRPPASTEQVMHPGAYIEGDAPARVRLRLRPVLGPGWRRRAAGVFGELQTRELMAAAGGGGSSDAAEGWGGDRYELWRSDAGADVLVMRWRWDSARDEEEFAAKLPDVVANAAKGEAVATARRAGTVTLAFAPTRALARRVARAAG